METDQIIDALQQDCVAIFVGLLSQKKMVIEKAKQTAQDFLIATCIPQNLDELQNQISSFCTRYPDFNPVGTNLRKNLDEFNKQNLLKKLKSFI